MNSIGVGAVNPLPVSTVPSAFQITVYKTLFVCLLVYLVIISVCLCVLHLFYF